MNISTILVSAPDDHALQELKHLGENNEETRSASPSRGRSFGLVFQSLKPLFIPYEILPYRCWIHWVGLGLVCLKWIPI